MENPCQYLDKGLGNDIQIPEGQITLIQLPGVEALLNQLVDHAFNPVGGRLGQGTDCRLHGISQHDYGRFLGLGFGAGIAEIILGHLLIFGSFLGPVVEEAGQAGTVVLGNNIPYCRAIISLIARGR